MNNDAVLKHPFPYTRRDTLFVLFSLVVAYLLSELIIFGGLGVSVPLFVLAFYVLAFAYLPHRSLFTPDALLTFLPVVLLSLCFLFYNNVLLQFFNVQALILLIPLNLSYVAGTNEYAFFSAGSLWDLAKAVVVFPLSNMNKGINALEASGKKSPGMTRVFKVIVGIVVISPVALIILLLLVSSDAAFQQVVHGVTSLLAKEWKKVLLKLFVALLFSFPIFSFLFSLRYKNRDYSMRKYRVAKRIRVIDPTYVNSGLWVVCIIYVLYIGTQLGYFFSAFRNMLPYRFTYAGYARRGFFELTAVCFINLLLIFFLFAFTKHAGGKPDRGSRATVTALSLLTGMLIVTAMSKMVLYIRIYGLTLSRVYATWFMIVLFCGFVLVALKVHIRRFRLFKSCAVLFITLYLALNYVNVDALIPMYNISHPNAQGKIDISVFDELSDSMVPQVAKLAGDPAYSVKVKKLLKKRGKNLSDDTWQNFCFSRAEAEKVISGQ